MFLLLPLVSGQSHIVLRSHWVFLAVMIPVYLAFGAVLGGVASIAGKLLHLRDDAERPLRLAVLTLTAVYWVNLAHAMGSWHEADRIAAILGLGVAGAAAAGLFWPRFRRATHFFVQPWAAAGLLAAGPVLATQSRLAGVLLLGVMFIVYSWLRKRKAPKGNQARLSLRLAALVALLLTGVPAAAWLVTRLHEPARLPAPAKPAERRPNVLLMVLDTVRADHLSVYGYHRRTTPWLERLAKTATFYRHCFAASYTTLASHASIFTGLYPRSHGAANLPPGLSVGEPLDPKWETLAERLAKLGYTNAAVIANVSYLSKYFGTDQGFHYYDDRKPLPCFPRGGTFPLRFLVRRLLGEAKVLVQAQRLYRSAAEINEGVYEVLEDLRAAGSPFFLFVNYMDAHSPYVPPEPFDRLFEGRHKGLTPLMHYDALRDDVALRRRTITDVERRHYVSQYDGAIAFLDAELGKLFARLQDLDLYDDSLIIVTADHGEAFGEHGFVGHEWSMHQHQIGVPLIMKYPRQKVGQVIDGNVSHVDLLPTILDTLGASAAEGAHGISLRSLSADSAQRHIYAEGYLKGSLVLSDRVKYPLMTWAIVAPGRWKLISNSDGNAELYHLDNDPNEQSNLAARQTDLSRSLLEALENWKRDHPLAQSSGRRIDPRAVERLRALGYVR
jgi:arylsulfatase A-like enzyme